MTFSFREYKTIQIFKLKENLTDKTQQIKNQVAKRTYCKAWFLWLSFLWWWCLRGSQQWPSPQWCSICQVLRCGSGEHWKISGPDWSIWNRLSRLCHPSGLHCCQSWKSKQWIAFLECYHWALILFSKIKLGLKNLEGFK